MKDEKVIQAYKGFKKDWTCNGYQFAVGRTEEHIGKVKACDSGFHSWENPLDVFGYYAPGESIYAKVEASGEIDHHSDGTKIASALIAIKEEIKLHDYIAEAFAWVVAHATPSKKEHSTGYSSASSATGYSSASSVEGKSAVAMNIGIQGRAKAGKDGAIVLVNHDDDYGIRHIRASKVGENGIKADTWYILNDAGEFEEWK